MQLKAIEERRSWCLIKEIGFGSILGRKKRKRTEEGEEKKEGVYIVIMSVCELCEEKKIGRVK